MFYFFQWIAVTSEDGLRAERIDKYSIPCYSIHGMFMPRGSVHSFELLKNTSKAVLVHTILSKVLNSIWDSDVSHLFQNFPIILNAMIHNSW